MTSDAHPATPDQFFKFAKTHQAEMVDLKFVDMLGSWQHCSFPIEHLDASTVRRRPRLRRLVDSRLDGDPRVGHDGRAGRRDHAPRSVLRQANHQRHRQHCRPGDAPGVHPRSATRRPEGRGVPARKRDCGHVSRGTGTGILHLRRGPLRAEPAQGLLPDRLGRGRLEHRPHRGTESRLQAELQGGLLPREPHRHVPRFARRDGLRDAQDRHRRRGAPSRGRDGRPERDRHEVPAAPHDGRSVHVVQGTSARTWRSVTARA